MAELNFGILDTQAPGRIAAMPQQREEQQAKNAMQFMQVQQAMGQNELAKYQLSSARRTDEETNKLRALYGEASDISDPNFIRKVYAINPEKGIALDKAIAERVAKKLTQTKTEGEIQAQKYKFFVDRLSLLSQDPSDAGIDRFLKEAVDGGVMSFELASAKSAQLKGMGLPERQKAILGAGQSASDALKALQPQSAVGKANADLKNAIANNAPLAEIAALTAARDSALVAQQQRAQQIAISGGQLGVAQGNLAVNQARFELQKNAPKLGLTDPADIDRVAVAMASGRIPVDRLNSTTAPMFAKLLSSNPDLDFTNLGIEQAGAKAGYTTSARIAARQTLTDVDATRAENISKGNLPPATGLNADKIMNAVIAINPNYNARDFGLQTSAEKSFNTGKQGDKTRSLNVAVSHLGTLDTAAAALRSGDIRVFNQFKQAWQRETGKTAPTDFNAVKELVADEIVAAVVPGVGALADRKALKETIMAKSSPAQLQGVIKQYKELLGGQLGGLEQQYTAATSKTDFKQRYLTPEAIAALTPGQKALPVGAASTTTSPPPAGVDAALWNVMTPDERKLWPK